MSCDTAGELQVTGFLLSVVRGYCLVNFYGTTIIRKGKRVYNTFLPCQGRSKKNPNNGFLAKTVCPEWKLDSIFVNG